VSEKPRRPGQNHLLELELQARYHRDRHRLYAARLGGSRPTSLSKLERLRRERELAEGSLHRAEEKERERGSQDTELR
jgi:hypothetical protein